MSMVYGELSSCHIQKTGINIVGYSLNGRHFFFLGIYLLSTELITKSDAKTFVIARIAISHHIAEF